MAERIPQSTAIRVPLKVFLTDGFSDATGKTIAVVISKNGAAFGNPSAGATNATEIANGWYYVDLSTTDTGTAGPLIVRGTATGVDNSEVVYNVVNAHNGGFDGVLNATIAGDAYTRLGAPAGASISADIAAVKSDTAAVKTQTDKLAFTVANQVDANVLDWKGSTAPAMTGDAYARLGAPAGASVSADVAAVKANTTTLVAGVTVTTNSDKTGYALTAGEETNIADALLKRDLSAVTGEAARSVLNAVRKLMNKVDISGTTLTVRKEDDTTAAYTQTIVADATQNPIKSLDTN